MMDLSVKEAYTLLELPLGADRESVESSYKRLAKKYHPAKNKRSEETALKFQQINIAFRKLIVKETRTHVMSWNDMIQQYENLCNQPASNGFHFSDSSSDEENCTSYSSKKKDNQKIKGGINNKTNSEEKKLTNEEERERQKKADKRRAKKKKRKEKKRAEKELKLKNGIQKLEDIDDQDKNSKDDSESSAGSEEEDLDPTSAFVAVAASKNKKISSSSLNKNKAVKKDRIKDSNNIIKKDEDEEENMDEISPVVLQSRQLAIRGNEMANVGQYAAAICLFSEAIKLDPRDFRFFGNRSYCFDRLSQFDKALRDAETAISLCTTWPKGYFRKGRALSGLKLYSEAEQAFEQVLKLDKNCDDAVQELLKVRTFQLTDMGFQRHQAESSIRQFGTVQSALDSLLAGVVAESSIPDETYLSDGEEYNSDDEDFRLHIPKPQISADDKMNPRNPEGLTSLWVGNVAPEVTEKMLVTMFTKFGTVTSVRLLSEKHCSFVNFKEKLSAGKAMESLQGKDCFGEKLLVRFPDNPIVNGQTTTILKKTKPVQTKVQQQQQQQQQQQIQLQQQMNLQQQSNIQQQQQKQSGPVNGDECYFWRTTGCIYGDKCRFKHIKEHKGIDKKPWQKPSV